MLYDIARAFVKLAYSKPVITNYGDKLNRPVLRDTKTRLAPQEKQSTNPAQVTACHMNGLSWQERVHVSINTTMDYKCIRKKSEFISHTVLL